ncbi:TOMM precursor leader peptide-binding protein [Streptomyces sp. NPDC058374]|uniref:TOMM precursor leader peptide-binding protein n=1 Tax=Streptomyces sp. NPDC058374 TaxID=3346466 RepID=UPI00364C6B66
MADPMTDPAPATAPAPAADAFDALAATRPRVRRDVLFTRTPGGVLFHNADGGFHLTGRTAYRFASLVLPHLTGRHRLDEVCAGFGPAQRAMAAELVRTLYARDFARDIPEADALRPQPEDAAGQRFAAQIAYIDHYSDAAPDRFARYRAARVAVLGTDETARWVALGLVRNGCGSLGLATAFPDVAAEAAQLAEEGCPVSLDRLPDPAEGPGWAALDGYDVVVVTGPGAAGLTHRLLTEGVPEGRTLLPAWAFGERLVMGPLTAGAAPTASGGCWSCALLRLGANVDAGTAAALWSEVAGGARGADAGAPGPLTGPVAAMCGNLLAYEVFRLTSGVQPAETRGQVLIQDLESLDVVAEPVPPHPRCRHCAPSGVPVTAPGTPEVPRTPSVAGAEEAQEVVDALNRTASALVRPHTGVFTRFDDDDLTQTPLKVSRVEVALPDGTVRAVTAVDIHHLAGARTRTLHRAAALYVDRTVPAPTADEQQGTPVHPAALATYGGTDDSPVTTWTPALSLRTGAPHRVPVAAARPFGPHNRLRTHLAATAGAGAGGSAAEAAGAALLSALAHTAVLDAVRGTPAAPLAEDPAADPELEFLHKTAAALALDVELLDLTGDGPAPVVLAREPGGRWAVAADLTRREAARAALRDLLGTAQLAAEAGEEPDTGDPFVTDLAPAALAVAGEQGGPLDAATTFPEILARLGERGRDALYLDTTSADLATGHLATARVLLTVPAREDGSDAR